MVYRTVSLNDFERPHNSDFKVTPFFDAEWMNDLKWLGQIFNDTKRCAVSLRQLSLLFLWQLTRIRHYFYEDPSTIWLAWHAQHNRSAVSNVGNTIRNSTHTHRSFISEPSKNTKEQEMNSESVKCNLFIFDHVTFIQFKICCCVQNLMKSDDFSLRYGDISVFKMAAVRHLGIVLPPYETTHEVSVAGRSCLSNFMSLW